LFILPILLVHGFVVIIPSIMGMYYSLTDWSGMGEPVFIGLENYRRLLFDDPAFMKALGNNVIWLLFFLTVPFALSLLAAFLLSQIKTGGYIYRVLIFIPYTSVMYGSYYLFIKQLKNEYKKNIPVMKIRKINRTIFVNCQITEQADHI
jgi:ABC-type sugar transport system permease subunit